MVYGGHRDTEQFQSIPVASQASPLHPGGVIELGRDYDGADLRWTRQARRRRGAGRWWAAWPATSCANTATATRTSSARDCSACRARCAATRSTTSRNSTPTCRASGTGRALDAATPACATAASASVSHDHYVVGANPDDSGKRRLRRDVAGAGVLYAAATATCTCTPPPAAASRRPR